MRDLISGKARPDPNEYPTGSARTSRIEGIEYPKLNLRVADCELNAAAPVVWPRDEWVVEEQLSKLRLGSSAS